MKNKFVEQSLLNALSFFKQALFSEEYASFRGLMQFIEPRIKLIGLCVILLTVGLLKNLALIFLLYLASIILAYLSKINIIYFLKRVWIFIPLFSLFIALPALFNIFSPGEVILFGITKQGIFSATLLILRVVTSVSFTILVVLTTRQMELLRALRSLGLPHVFVNTFMMCYRYLYVFIKITEDTYLAMKARMITNQKNQKLRKIIAGRIAAIWEKSRLMSEELYLAMLSRGYSGEPKVWKKFYLN